MKLLLSTLITLALIVNSEKATDNNEAANVDSYVSYFETGTEANFEVGAPFYLDVDKDGSQDFLFHTVSVHEDGVIRTKYMVKGLGQNQVLAAAGHAAISETGEEIGSSPEFENLEWSDRHGEILEGNFDGVNYTYNGTWSGDRAQYIGFKLVKDNKTHFGYAQVEIDPAAESASVVGYAVNRVPGASVEI